MKSLGNLTYEDKGSILFDLFPELMPELIEKLGIQCKCIIETKYEWMPFWPSDRITADYYLFLAEDVQQLLERWADKLYSHAGIFSRELFKDPRYIFVIDFIQRVSVRVMDLSNAPRYTLAVQLFFGPEILPR